MTVLGSLPARRIPLDPDVRHPPFTVSMAMPAGFHLFDSHPGTWRRSARLLLHEALDAERLSATELSSAMAVLESLVTNCRRGGSALNVIRVFRLADGTVATAGVHLAWVREKQTSSLGRIRDTMPRNGSITEVVTPTGPAIIHRRRRNAQVPGTSTIVSMDRIQLFVPFPGTDWTVIVSTASAFPALTPALDQLIVAIAQSMTRSPLSAAAR